MTDSKKWHGGKGDRNRTKNREAFEQSWERIFGAKGKADEREKDNTKAAAVR